MTRDRAEDKDSKHPATRAVPFRLEQGPETMGDEQGDHWLSEHAQLEETKILAFRK